MVELVYTVDLKSAGRKVVRVQFPLRAPNKYGLLVRLYLFGGLNEIEPAAVVWVRTASGSSQGDVTDELCSFD
jgi:hypothetical protein